MKVLLVLYTSVVNGHDASVHTLVEFCQSTNLIAPSNMNFASVFALAACLYFQK